MILLLSDHTWAGNCIVLQKPLAADKAAIPAQIFHLSLEKWIPFWADKTAMAAKAAKAAKTAMAAKAAIPAIAVIHAKAVKAAKAA